MPASTPQLISIFADALECESPEALQQYLDHVCAGQPELRARIEGLLAAHARAGEFLERPLTVSESVLPESVEAEGKCVGTYKLLQQIGEGGFGVVYMAEQECPVRRLVALKVIKPGMDSREVIARFESERQTLAIMDHPNIAKVFDAGTTDGGRPYFVMELVKGIPITEFCDECRMPTKERLSLFVSVCRAVQHAHHKGIIHRDIKPSNVLITLHDGAPVVKVIDFGVAKAITQKLTDRTLYTRFGQMIGTPAYMSPEQAAMSGLDIDTRSDVYSLGVLLYELLTGTTPLDKKLLREAAYEELQRLIREADTPRPSTRLTALGNSAAAMAMSRGMELNRLTKLLAGELDWIVMKALEKDRNRRYGTPENMAEDVERYLRHDAILARPPSTTYKLRKFASRNRTAALVIVGVCAALIIGICGTTVALISQSKLRAEAEAQTKVAAQQAKIARAVISFQNRMLTAVSPERMLGDKVTVLEVMQSAVQELDSGELKDNPLVEASVRQAVGESLSDLGRFAEAETQWRKAISARLEYQKDDHEDLAYCHFGLGNALLKQNKLIDAERSLREALDMIERIADPEMNVVTSTSAVLICLGDALSTQGRSAEAMQAYQDAMDMNAQAKHVDEEVTADCNSRMAKFLHEVGRLAEAQSLYEEVLATRRRIYPAGHPRIGHTATSWPSRKCRPGIIHWGMRERHIVCLTDEARVALTAMLRTGVHRARVLRRAQVLLKADEGLSNGEISEHTGVSERAIREIRRRYGREGLERALHDAPRSGKPPKFTARQQKQVIALACTDPPEGRARWTLTLLAETAVQRGIVKSLSKSEVALWLAEADLKPWQKKDGAFPSSRRNSASGWTTCSTNTSGQKASKSR